MTWRWDVAGPGGDLPAGGLATPATTGDDLAELVGLRPGVYHVRDGDGRVHLVADGQSEPLGRPDPAEHATLRDLASEPKPPGELAGAGSLLRRLWTGGWLSVTVVHRDRPLYTMVPHRRPPGPPPEALPAAYPTLSRFALLRRAGDGFALESPRAWCTVRIHDLAVLPALAGDRGAAIAQGLTARLRRDLWWAGMLTDPAGAEEGELRLRQWSAHELWFHDRTRVVRHDPERGYGGTWWAHGTFVPLPAVREPFGGPVVRLYRPDLAAIRAADPPLTDVLETRRTIRTYDDRAPLRAEQLGEFLYRCCRNRRQFAGTEHLSRPYPSGGTLYELEVYPAVHHVAGLAPGLYHYGPDRHQLELVCGGGRAVDRLVRAAVRRVQLTSPPQVVLVVAARFGRVMWKYESMAYALVLKNVGVLYQLMYTVATAMGLAPCGLGGAGADTFAQVSGLDPVVEGSVGEFLLGSCPPPDRPKGNQDE